MLKKIIALSMFLYFSMEVHAQFVRGIGLFVGVTSSRHRYINTSAIDSSYAHKFPAPSHKSREYVSWSVGILGEFLKYDHIRWQTEIEYCNKGAVEHPFLSPFTDERGPATANALSYIQWNNFAKIFFNEGYRGTPYIMIGGRIEYNLQRAIGIYPTVVGALPKLNVSPDVAAGYEFVTYSKFKPFVELHYNPDLINKQIGNIAFNNRTWELRVGVIYRPEKRLDNCNAPRFRGSGY